MLVRPAGSAGFEVYMLRRSEASHFVPDVYVFPGGTLDPADASERSLARARGVDDESLTRQYRAKSAPAFPAPFGSPNMHEAAGLLIAALRELFEEAGVLIACDSRGVPLRAEDLAPHAQRLLEARRLVRDGTLPFAALLEELDAYADGRALALFSQWITPPIYPRRYNAHFYVAQASADEVAVADAFETHDGVWIAPQAALEAHERGEFRMVYPTIKHVERLAQFPDAPSLLDFARSKTIYTIMPDTPAEREFSLPPDLEFAW
jgi:8-oxo-dGTP pyrophosphatase MutT (NUDIX family)